VIRLLVVIDRFEGRFAVCEGEDGRMINIEKERIPDSAREGDVLSFTGETITIDEEETKRRRERILKLAEDVWE
jgi:hypothetical protein